MHLALTARQLGHCMLIEAKATASACDTCSSVICQLLRTSNRHAPVICQSLETNSRHAPVTVCTVAAQALPRVGAGQAKTNQAA
jgi:hypothetical protein